MAMCMYAGKISIWYEQKFNEWLTLYIRRCVLFMLDCFSKSLKIDILTALTIDRWP